MAEIPVIYQIGDNSCWSPGLDIDKLSVSEVFNYTKQKRLPILNSPLAFPDHIVYATRVDIETARALAQEAIKRGITIDSYIGHQSTAELATKMLGVEVPARRAMYQPADNEIALVLRLKKRLSKPDDIKDVKPDDLEILVLHYYRV